MSRLRGEQGAGLVEVLVVMVVLGILSTAVFSVLAATVRAEHMAGEVRGEIESVRVALDRLRKELRSTREVRTGSDADTLNLWLDSNQDDAPAAQELITYELAPVGGGFAELRRWNAAQTAASPQIVARDLLDLDPFGYDPAVVNASVVTVTLTAASDSTRVDKQTTHATTVRLRNE